MTDAPAKPTRVLALYDAHWPLTIPEFYDPRKSSKQETPILNWVADWKPEIIVWGGDQLDLNCIGHWSKGKIKLIEGQRLSKDFEGFNQLLDKFDKIVDKNAKEKVMLIGNHCAWLDDLIDENPQAYDGVINYDKNLKTKERGYKVVPRRKVYKYGKLNFIHGDYSSGFLPQFYAKAIAQLYARMNVVFGHFHSAQSFVAVSPIDTHSTISQGVPCLTHTNPLWLKNKPNAWTNGFFAAYVQPNGLFNHQIVNISHGSFVFEGQLYK
jgi:hypothetical protein